MSDTKLDAPEHITHNDGRPLTTVTLTAEQFEALYMTPRHPRLQGDIANRVGNPTPLGVSAFLLAHVPLAMDLLNFQGATNNSGVAMLGSFYACAGVGLYLAGIMEWIIGNTFPSVVFITFGGFWTTYGIIVQPSFGVAASFAPAGFNETLAGMTATAAGAATREYNAGLGMYFVIWGVLDVIYFVASLRTNVPFAIVFFALIFAFEFIAAGYFHTGQGLLDTAAQEFRIAGGFAFVTGLAGFYINIYLLLAAVQFPVNVPLLDLSTRFLKPKQHMA